MRNRSWLVGAFLAFWLCGEAGAASVPIVNASFEDPVTAEGFGSPVTGWGFAASDIINPTVALFPDEAPDGLNVASVENEISQVLTTTLERNTKCALTVEVGDSLFTTFSYKVQLLANSTVLDEDDNTLTPTDGTFETTMVMYTALPGDPNIGQPLEIKLIGDRAFFDDVRLDCSSILDPAELPATNWQALIVLTLLLAVGMGARIGKKPALMLALAFLLPIDALAVVPVANPSFEDFVLADGGVIGNAPGWTITANVGTLNPTAALFPAEAPDGQNILTANLSGSAQQTLTTLLAVNSVCTLRVDVGRSIPQQENYRVQLLAGAMVLAEDDNTLNPAGGTFETTTLQYTALPGDPNIGQALGILLQGESPSSNETSYFDNVRLECRSLDAPGMPASNARGLVLMALLLASSMALWMRRRSRQA